MTPQEEAASDGPSETFDQGPIPIILEQDKPQRKQYQKRQSTPKSGKPLEQDKSQYEQAVFFESQQEYDKKKKQYDKEKKEYDIQKTDYDESYETYKSSLDTIKAELQVLVDADVTKAKKAQDYKDELKVIDDKYAPKYAALGPKPTGFNWVPVYRYNRFYDRNEQIGTKRSGRKSTAKWDESTRLLDVASSAERLVVDTKYSPIPKRFIDQAQREKNRSPNVDLLGRAQKMWDSEKAQAIRRRQTSIKSAQSAGIQAREAYAKNPFTFGASIQNFPNITTDTSPSSNLSNLALVQSSLSTLKSSYESPSQQLQIPVPTKRGPTPTVISSPAISFLNVSNLTLTKAKKSKTRGSWQQRVR